MARVSGIIHRYDRNKGIYQCEVSIGGITSKLVLPYEGSARQATDRQQIAQDSDIIIPAVVDTAGKIIKDAITWSEMKKRLGIILDASAQPPDWMYQMLRESEKIALSREAGTDPWGIRVKPKKLPAPYES
uniref:Uncharacterized protein n=1 Tax=viral metagenome TaxID=1070528 RepID=A0A6M3IG64_9ZZZZ